MIFILWMVIHNRQMMLNILIQIKIVFFVASNTRHPCQFLLPFWHCTKNRSVVSMFPSIIDTKTRQYLQIMKLLVNWNSCLPPEEEFLNNPHMKFSESPLNQLLVDHSQPFLTSQTEWKEIKRFNLLHKPVLLWKER